jgi:hypothetical protein
MSCCTLWTHHSNLMLLIVNFIKHTSCKFTKIYLFPACIGGGYWACFACHSSSLSSYRSLLWYTCSPDPLRDRVKSSCIGFAGPLQAYCKCPRMGLLHPVCLSYGILIGKVAWVAARQMRDMFGDPVKWIDTVPYKNDISWYIRPFFFRLIVFTLGALPAQNVAKHVNPP